MKKESKKINILLLNIVIILLSLKPLLAYNTNNICTNNIYQKINITYTYDSFYTGSIENKLFLAKNLFTNNKQILLANTLNYSEGVFIDKKDNSYILFSNTNNFSNAFSLLINYFKNEDDLKITDTFYFQSFWNYFLLNVNPFYNEELNDKNFILIGLINYFLNTDLFLAVFDGKDINKAIIFGTSSLDYPFYLSQYQDSYFNGFIVLSLIDKNNYRDFIDTKLNFDSKRYNSNSILITFVNKDLKIIKYFVLRFPNKIIDLSIIKRSMDNILLKVDYIDNISNYYISSNFVNINFTDITLANTNYNTFTNFYVDNSLIDFKNYQLSLKKIQTNLIFRKNIF
jgi:hypothetical protein